ncbi:MAG: 3-methyl-2-oxobutanoate hydroxymethyltransferase [Gammaproteobacteria bacterium]|jgi:3-methyl-2-oxobutanoate hydroxymethyltransferase|nr:3-methyl-2-oxobutanoate hydroxymethyltransferase [Gammaproteobacteria bacterium]
MKPVTITTLQAMKQAGEKITCLTAYDYSFAHLLDSAGIDMIIVGDSVGMVCQGHETTLPVTLDDMVYHTRCVASGCQRTLIVADMPFLSYEVSPDLTFSNAGRLMKEGYAHVVKIEGGRTMAETVRFLTERGIPVCGHLGLTPQSVHQLGGFRVQGRDKAAAERLLNDARALQEAGASILVLEAIPSELAKHVSAELTIPTIGIGAGPGCDGQVLVLQDMLGIYPRRSPKFSKNFMEENGTIQAAVKAFIAAVREQEFPGPEHSF